MYAEILVLVCFCPNMISIHYRCTDWLLRLQNIKSQGSLFRRVWFSQSSWLIPKRTISL